MPLHIIHGDITQVPCDAIVNAANSTLLGGGGVDGAIHRAAGPGLAEECRGLGGCRTGEAKITRGYALPCRYVIHTVGPVWAGGKRGEHDLLCSCYRNSLRLAAENGCESVAFPLISAGAYAYPKEDALRAAVDEISRFLQENEMLVTLVIYERDNFRLGSGLYRSLSAYIEGRDTEGSVPLEADRKKSAFLSDGNECPSPPMAAFIRPMPAREECFEESAPYLYEADYAAQESDSAYRDLTEAVSRLDETFSETLLRKIDERGMTDAECYKKANIDRKLFSKIRGDKYYKPSKPTAIAFAVALQMDLPETADLLRKAGYALSPSTRFDVIIEYFLEHRIYNIHEINEALFAYDQTLLGC